MRFGSVCSGIEAASMAWHALGWSAAFFSEIEKFPSAVLAHHYGSNLPGEAASSNGVPNLGDMTKFEEWPDYAIDLLVGGTPCQDYSVAGLRLGMAGSRGRLTLTYVGIAARYKPRWIVWENVPGVLTSNGGRDFARFLGDLAGVAVTVPEGGWKSAGIVAGIGEGYGLAYRVLDAQYCRASGYRYAVPQRRRRVFVVGYSGNWRRAAAVLFDAQSLRGDPPPRREKGQGVAPTISARPSGGGGLGTDFDLDGGLVAAFGGGNTRGSIEAAACLAAKGQRVDFEVETFVAHVPEVAASLTRGAESAGKGGYAGRRQEDDVNLVATQWKVRRLMPIECERLQGFPDGFTDIAYRGKPAADGPRYKALGNSMAVNVMRALGERISIVDAIEVAA
jgi:DNA (cytosine-5)-methyltransferase 1